MAETVGSLLVRLGLDSGAFRSGLDVAEKEFRSAQKRFEKLGSKIAGIGKTMTLGITLPFIAAGAAAVKGATEQAAAMGQVESALASMGAVSGKTAGELAKTADAMEMHSLFAADEILTKVTANLLTFGNVAGQQFDRAQQAAIDMATRLGSDPQSAAVMLGKALNDPIKGITALTRVGVQFTESQKAQIKAFTDTGQTAKAQGIILSEVERQFKGAAQAAADTQPWRQAQVAIDQAMDGIGEAILPVIPVIADAIKSIASAFADLSPEMQKTVVIGLGLAAALGPVLTVIGGIVKLAAPLAAAFTTTAAASATAGTAAAGASTGFAALAAAAAPWLAAGAAIAGVGYLIYKNWDTIAPVLEGLWQTISETLGPPLQEIVSTIGTMLTELWSGPFGDLARGAINVLGEVGGALLEVFGPVALGALKLMIQAVGNALTALLEFGRAIGSLFRGDIQGAFQHLGSMINSLFGGLPGKVIGWIGQMVTGIKSWIVDKLSAVWNRVKQDVEAVGKAFFWLYDKVVGHSYVPDMVDKIGEHMRRLDKELVEPARKATSKAAEAFRALQEEVAGILARLFPENAERITFEKEKAALDAYHKAGKLGAEEHAAAVRALQREYMGLSRDYLGVGAGETPSTDITVTSGQSSLEELNSEALRKLPDAFQKVGENADAMKVRVVESFGDMVQGALGEIDRLISGIKSGDWLDVISGIVGAIGKIAQLFGGGGSGGLGGFGDVLSSIGSLFGGARAAGGPVSAGRSYLVGEKGPELFQPRSMGRIVPNNELGSGRVEVRVVPSPYFDAQVDGIAANRVAVAAPSIAQAGAEGGVARMSYRQSRRWR